MSCMENEIPPPPILDLVIELGIARMASMVGDSPDTAYRPRICVLVDHSRRTILHFELSQPDDSEATLLNRALNEMGVRLGGLPRQILTRNPTIVNQFKEPLRRLGVDMMVRESLPSLDEAMASLHGGPLGGGDKREKGLMTVAGITLDHVIAFAEAGKLFFEAAPWQHLWDDDLIEIKSPPGPKGTRFTQVLGAAGETMGLGFVATRAAHEKMQNGGGLASGTGHWNMLYNALDDLPFEDGELWEQHNLPVANESAYPRLGRYTASAGMNQPKAEDLVWAEGLLRALAASTEAEFDTGRWEKEVTTIKGPLVYQFEMPILLEQIEGVLEVVKANESPQNKARRLCRQSRSARGRRVAQLAKEAIELDPDFCEPWLILSAQQSADISKIPLLEKAVQAGERELGPEFFSKNAGRFGQFPEAETYLDARITLAGELLVDEQFDAGIAHLQALLQLDRSEGNEVRQSLSEALLFADRLDELDELLNKSDFRNDLNTEWQYTRTLLSYRREGDTETARNQLARAVDQNPLVAKLLTGRGLTRVAFAPDKMMEAMEIAKVLGESWHEANGALAWLKSQTPAGSVENRPRKSKSKKKKR